MLQNPMVTAFTPSELSTEEKQLILLHTMIRTKVNDINLFKLILSDFS